MSDKWIIGSIILVVLLVLPSCGTDEATEGEPRFECRGGSGLFDGPTCYADLPGGYALRRSDGGETTLVARLDGGGSVGVLAPSPRLLAVKFNQNSIGLMTTDMTYAVTDVRHDDSFAYPLDLKAYRAWAEGRDLPSWHDL